jgi:hypothetical protein
MQAAIYIEPHERFEAVNIYRDRLTDQQIEEIEEAPEGALIRISFGVGAPGTTVQIIPEG